MIRPEPESGMQFYFYNEDDFFPIESEIKKANIQNVRTVEYIYHKVNKLLLIEAKSSAPKPIKSDENTDFDKFITQIAEKVTHSVNILFGGVLNYTDITLPKSYYDKKYGKNNIKLVALLIIKGHKPEYILPIQKALNSQLKSYRKIWQMDILVINDETAKKNKYIE